MDMTEQKNDFGVGSVEQNIIRMAVPMTVAQILNLLYNLVDRMYIGHIPGSQLTGTDRCGNHVSDYQYDHGICQSLWHGRRTVMLYGQRKTGL